MKLKNALDSLEPASYLDGAGNAIQRVLDPAFDNTAVGNLLRGRWIGHPIHPALVNITIGSWVSAVALDLAGGQAKASKLIIGIGLASAPAAIATGWADWSKMNTRQRRAGLIHAASNATGVSLFLWSLVRRRAGTDTVAKALAAGGLTAAGVGGIIGGHLAYSSTGSDTTPGGKHSVDATTPGLRSARTALD